MVGIISGLMSSTIGVSEWLGLGKKVAPTPAPEPEMTRAEYERIQKDMTYEQVVSIVGSSGTRRLVNGPYTVYKWDDGGPGVTINFENNKVVTIIP